MGLSNFHGPAEGVLPILVMNTVMSLAILKNLVKSVLELIGAASRGLGQEAESAAGAGAGRRRVSITQFKSPGHAGGRSLPAAAECSVCLSMFEEEEEVSELSCKHFFHRSCLDKWFDNHHSTCPLCRSIH